MIVLDSSFLIAFYNERDVHHERARLLMERFLAGAWGEGLLLEYVFVEIATVLLARRNLSVASRVGQLLLDARELEFMRCSGYFDETMSSFTSQSGTRLSFCDIAIANVARSRAEGQILTFDEEFLKIPDLRVNPAS